MGDSLLLIPYFCGLVDSIHTPNKVRSMNILVCISHVPDTTTRVAVGADGKSINPQGVKFDINPYDEFAVEEGIRLKEAHGGSVTVLTVGGDAAKDALRKALAMGCDTAVLVKDDARTDSWLVANSIVEAAKELAPDVIIMGRQSIDYDSFVMAPMVAELLGWPNISMVSSWSISGTTVTAERDIEGGKESVSTTLPVVISAQKGLNEPRFAKLPDIMKAKSKPIAERAPSTVSARTETVAMTLPDMKRLNKIVGDTDADLDEIVRLLHEEAKMI
jgi:electron transfer flavoprotein beta subunit